MIAETIDSMASPSPAPAPAEGDPAVSIITICFRNPADLALTLRSLEGIDPHRIELLVIDGSPDDSCTGVVEQSPLAIRYRHGRDSGKYDAMNKGLDHCRGRSVLMLNSGDAMADPARFNALVAANDALLDSHILYGDAQMLFGEQRVLSKAPATMDDPSRLPYPSHQSTMVPMRFYRRERYDAAMDISADAKLLHSAYSQLPSRHVGEVIAVFAYGGVSSCERSWAQVWQHFQENRAIHPGSPLRHAKFLLRLSARRLFVVLFGPERLMAVQARLASRRAGTPA